MNAINRELTIDELEVVTAGDAKAFAGATASASVSTGGSKEVGWGGAVIIGALILFGM